MSELPWASTSWSFKGLGGRYADSLDCASGMPPTRRHSPVKQAAMHVLSRQARSPDRYGFTEQSLDEMSTDEKCNKFVAAKRKMNEVSRQIKGDGDGKLAPVRVVKGNAPIDDDNQISFTGKKTKVSTEPTANGPCSADRDDNVRPVREQARDRAIAEALRIMGAGPTREQKLAKAIVREQVQQGMYTAAQMSIRGGELGKTDNMPQWQSGREDPSGEAQRSLKSRRHAGWEQATKSGTVGRKASADDYELMPGHRPLTGRTRISQDEGGYAPKNTPRNTTDGEEQFLDLHSIEVHPDRNGNGDEHFGATNRDHSAKTIGFQKGDDRKKYDAGRSNSEELLRAIKDLMMLASQNYKVNEEKMEALKGDIRAMIDEAAKLSQSPQDKIRKMIDKHFSKDTKDQLN